MGRQRMPGAIERALKGVPDVAQPVNPISAPITNAPPQSGYVFVPSIGLYVAKQRTLQGSNWYDCHKGLQANGERMPTIPEFVEFLKYLRANPNGVKDTPKQEVESILDDILAVRDPYRAEWLDADFKVKGKLMNKKLYINYNHELKGGNLEPKNTEPLEQCLMKDRQPGIDLDSWLSNPTKQGLPQKNVKIGSIWYWYPRSDDNSVARFSANSVRANLDCYRYPSNSSTGLGVRAIRRASP